MSSLFSHSRSLTQFAMTLVLVVTILLSAFPAAQAQTQDSGVEAVKLSEQVAAEGVALKKEGPSEPVVVPETSEKAMRYYRSGNVLWWVNLLISLLIPVLFLWSGFSARLRSWAMGLGKKWFLALAVYLVAFNLINYLLNLPLAYYQGFVRQHAYDLSNQAFSKWMGDSVKGLGVGLIMAVLFTWIPYLLIRKSPRRWWLYTGLGVAPFFFLVNMIAPIWIAPLFNEFGPMKNQALEAQILNLADRAGIEGSRVFEVNKSVDTEAVNAYVSGFMGTKRIVLWDTIIEKLSEEELLFVMGHEMGHYKLGHIIALTLLISAMTMLGLYLIYRVSGGLIAKYRHRFGFSELGDFASLPLLSLLLGLFFFILTPGFLTISRHYEHEADRFGLELTHDNYAAATAFVKLQEENLGNPYPGPLYKLWRSGHPPLGERIQFCNEYRPWETGDPLRYGDRFRDSE